jgi:hypothetical protein
MNNHTRQPAFLIGNGRFRLRERLTGFGGARNIIRIRTKWPAAIGATGFDAAQAFDTTRRFKFGRPTV